MAHIVITSPADADAAHILAELGAMAGAKIAERYISDFDKLFVRLATYPQSGSPRAALGPHVRICIVSPYVVIYEHVDAGEVVTIMRIVHGRRKITRRLLKQIARRR